MYTRATRRHNDWKKAIRKRQKDRSRFASVSLLAGDWYDNLHQYSKNKIHCSCPLCRSKTNNPGSVGPVMNWSKRDLIQLEDMESQLDEVSEAVIEP